MVFDKFENYLLYIGLGERIATAFAWLKETDLAQTPAGKYEIDKGDVFALVQEYDTKDINKCKLEGHHQFIDIQYLVSGTEQMGVALLKNQQPVLVKEESDCAFYAEDASLVKLEASMFAIFFPDDLHMPGITFNQVSHVKKVVVKVRV